MRSILIFGLMFTLAAVSAVQAQQVAAPASAEQPSPRLVEIPAPMIQVDLTPVQAAKVQSRHETVTADATQQMSATTLLAIIGAAVVVLALVVLLR